jgi:hypothetical protein
MVGFQVRKIIYWTIDKIDKDTKMLLNINFFHVSLMMCKYLHKKSGMFPDFFSKNTWLLCFGEHANFRNSKLPKFYKTRFYVLCIQVLSPKFWSKFIDFYHLDKPFGRLLPYTVFQCKIPSSAGWNHFLRVSGRGEFAIYFFGFLKFYQQTPCF